MDEWFGLNAYGTGKINFTMQDNILWHGVVCNSLPSDMTQYLEYILPTVQVYKCNKRVLVSFTCESKMITYVDACVIKSNIQEMLDPTLNSIFVRLHCYNTHNGFDMTVVCFALWDLQSPDNSRLGQVLQQMTPDTRYKLSLVTTKHAFTRSNKSMPAAINIFRVVATVPPKASSFTDALDIMDCKAHVCCLSTSFTSMDYYDISSHHDHAMVEFLKMNLPHKPIYHLMLTIDPRMFCIGNCHIGGLPLIPQLSYLYDNKYEVKTILPTDVYLNVTISISQCFKLLIEDIIANIRSSPAKLKIETILKYNAGNICFKDWNMELHTPEYQKYKRRIQETDKQHALFHRLKKMLTISS